MEKKFRVHCCFFLRPIFGEIKIIIKREEEFFALFTAIIKSKFEITRTVLKQTNKPKVLSAIPTGIVCYQKVMKIIVREFAGESDKRISVSN